MLTTLATLAMIVLVGFPQDKEPPTKEELAAITERGRDLAGYDAASSSVISRLEDADDQGHSLGLLRRVAQALHQRIEIRFLPNQDATPRV